MLLLSLQNLERADENEWKKMSDSVGRPRRSHRLAAEGQESHLREVTKAIEYTWVVHSVESGRRKENRY